MSTKTIDLIAENEVLNKKVAKLKTTNSLLVESEKELAKKNQANQRVIKLLVEKLKGLFYHGVVKKSYLLHISPLSPLFFFAESDEMLEAAYEKGALEDNSGAIFQPTFKMDFFGAGGGGGGGNNVHQEEENERRSSNAHAEEEMEELKDELESYKQNAGRLSGHLFDFQSISEEVSKILTSVAEGERQNEAGKAYVKTLVER